MDPGEHSDRETPAQRPTLPEGGDLGQVDLHPASLSFPTVKSGK